MRIVVYSNIDSFQNTNFQEETVRKDKSSLMEILGWIETCILLNNGYLLQATLSVYTALNLYIFS